MENYYLNQAGNGVPLNIYYGSRSQRGNGFFGRLISRAVLPVLRYLGTKAFETGKNMYEDFKSGVDIEDSFKNRGLDTLQTIINDGIQSVRQRGKGIKMGTKKKKRQIKKKCRAKKPTTIKKRNLKKARKTPRKKRVQKKKRTTQFRVADFL